ncbi:glycosyltransferase [Ramlibacter monticola]|uniref:Glycosyltransferase n=1 Tax=Ramlibacter monticola TaxID=1926872 RepID=A0A937CZA9_9BURK|nr:glycosyltransferase [Ramlibacter monticola]MBL0395027.1 glycosyltransferase [Ramlibacter monticola]
MKLSGAAVPAANARIAIVLPTLHGGGAERLHLNLAHDWIRRGYAVDFVLMRKKGELLPLVSSRIRVIDLSADRIREAILPLRRYLRQEHPDYTIAALWPLTSAAVAAWLLSGRRGRLFLSDHSHLSTSCVRDLHVPLSLLGASMGLTYPLATGVIAVSEGVKNDMLQLAHLQARHVNVIYNPTATGVSPRRESNATVNSLWGERCRQRILTVGNLKPAKDHATLLKAFAQLPLELGARLVILGEGKLRPQLEQQAAELGIADRISMPGFVADPYPWFRSADLFVCSSQWEGFGNVLVEALECGVPVVSTDCPSGPSEILEGGRFGRLVRLGDPAALAQAIEAHLGARHDRELLRKRALAFAVPTISEEYLRYFAKGLG